MNPSLFSLMPLSTQAEAVRHLKKYTGQADPSLLETLAREWHRMRGRKVLASCELGRWFK